MVCVCVVVRVVGRVVVSAEVVVSVAATNVQNKNQFLVSWSQIKLLIGYTLVIRFLYPIYLHLKRISE